jgi:hypothetical protein
MGLRWPDVPSTLYDQVRDYADGTRTYADLMQITGGSYKTVTRAFRTVRDRGFKVAIKYCNTDHHPIPLRKADYILYRDRYLEGWTSYQIAKYLGPDWTARKVEHYWLRLRTEYEPGRRAATWRQRANESY